MTRFPTVTSMLYDGTSDILESYHPPMGDMRFSRISSMIMHLKELTDSAEGTGVLYPRKTHTFPKQKKSADRRQLQCWPVVH